jgi:hypothetical protein
LRIRFTNSDHSLWAVLVLESASSARNDRPSLTHDLGSGGDRKGRGDNVGTGVEENDFAPRELPRRLSADFTQIRIGTNLGKDGLERSGIISPTVTLGTIVLDTNKLADMVGGILGVGLAEDLARAIEQH